MKELKKDDLITDNVSGLYLDNIENVSKVRVTLCGRLIGVVVDFVKDESNGMYKLNLFKESDFVIPLSKSKCSKLSVVISPKDCAKDIPSVYYEEAIDLPDKTRYPYTLMDGQTGDIVMGKLPDDSDDLLMLTTEFKDNSFENEYERSAYHTLGAYSSAFNTNSDKHFVQFIAYGFASSLPFITPNDAATFALKHEHLPLKECLENIWNDYKSTDAYKTSQSL